MSSMDNADVLDKYVARVEFKDATGKTWGLRRARWDGYDSRHDTWEPDHKADNFNGMETDPLASLIEAQRSQTAAEVKGIILLRGSNKSALVIPWQCGGVSDYVRPVTLSMVHGDDERALLRTWSRIPARNSRPITKEPPRRDLVRSGVRRTPRDVSGGNMNEKTLARKHRFRICPSKKVEEKEEPEKAKVAVEKKSKNGKKEKRRREASLAQDVRNPKESSVRVARTSKKARKVKPSPNVRIQGKEDSEADSELAGGDADSTFYDSEEESEPGHEEESTVKVAEKKKSKRRKKEKKRKSEEEREVQKENVGGEADSVFSDGEEDSGPGHEEEPEKVKVAAEKKLKTSKKGKKKKSKKKKEEKKQNVDSEADSELSEGEEELEPRHEEEPAKDKVATEKKTKRSKKGKAKKSKKKREAKHKKEFEGPDEVRLGVESEAAVSRVEAGGISEYELARLVNISRNAAFMAELGILGEPLIPKEVRKPKKTKPKGEAATRIQPSRKVTPDTPIVAAPISQPQSKVPVRGNVATQTVEISEGMLIDCHRLVRKAKRQMEEAKNPERPPRLGLRGVTTPTKKYSRLIGNDCPVTPPKFDGVEDDEICRLSSPGKKAVHRALLQAALQLAEDYFKCPLDPHRKRNQELTALIALQLAKFYAKHYNNDFSVTEPFSYHTKQSQVRETTHEKSVCLVAQRFSNNQFNHGSKPACLEVAQAVTLLEEVQVLADATMNFPSTEVIRKVANVIITYMSTNFFGDALKTVLRTTYRITLDEVNVGHVANFLVSSTGYALTALGYKCTCTTQHNLRSTLLHSSALTDVENNMVLVTGDLVDKWRAKYAVQFSLFGDSAFASSMSSRMFNILEATAAVPDAVNGPALEAVGLDQKDSPAAMRNAEVVADIPAAMRIAGDVSKPASVEVKSAESLSITSENRDKESKVGIDVRTEDLHTPDPSEGGNTRKRHRRTRSLLQKFNIAEGSSIVMRLADTMSEIEAASSK